MEVDRKSGIKTCASTMEVPPELSGGAKARPLKLWEALITERSSGVDHGATRDVRMVDSKLFRICRGLTVVERRSVVANTYCLWCTRVFIVRYECAYRCRPSCGS